MSILLKLAKIGIISAILTISLFSFVQETKAQMSVVTQNIWKLNSPYVQPVNNSWKVRSDGGFCIGTDCITSWPTGGGGGSAAWEEIWTNAITPTTTGAGIYVTASSTIQNSFRVDGSSTTTNHFSANSVFYVKDSKIGVNTQNPRVLFDVPGIAWFQKISASSTPGFIDFKFIDGKSGTTTEAVSYRTVGINTSGYEDYHVFYGNKSNYVTWGGVMPRTYSSTTDMFCDFGYTATSTSVVYPFKIYIKTLDDNENPELLDGFDLNNAVSITSPATAGLVDYVSIPVTTTDYLAPGDIFRIKLEVTGIDTRGQVSFLNNLHCWWR